MDLLVIYNENHNENHNEKWNVKATFVTLKVEGVNQNSHKS